MRENDDDSGDQSTAGGDLADGLGETAEPGSSGADPYGWGAFDDDYDDGVDGGTYDDGDAYDADDGSGADDADDDSGVYDAGDDDDLGDYGDGDASDYGADDSGALDVDASGVSPEGANPLDGVTFLLGQLRDSLFGTDDDPLAADAGGDAAFEPVGLGADPDTDAAGTGLADAADLEDAASPFDLGGDGGGHDPS